MTPDFEAFRAELREALTGARSDPEGTATGVVIDAATGLSGTDLDSLAFVVHFRNERDGSEYDQRWSDLGDLWRSMGGSPQEIAGFVINDLHEQLFAVD